MNFLTLLVTTVVVCAIYTEAYSANNGSSKELNKRQATNADQMVQNILQWLQTVYAQNPRRSEYKRIVRQGTLRQYLPPANTEKPRPFQPGYAPPGLSPEPPFPFPTNPVTGGVAVPDIGPQPGPAEGSGGGEPQPGPFEIPTTRYPFPSEPEQPSESPSYPEVQPVIPTTSEPGLPESEPTVVPPEEGSLITSTQKSEHPQQHEYTEVTGAPVTHETSPQPEYTTARPSGIPTFTYLPGTESTVSQEGTADVSVPEEAEPTELTQSPGAEHSYTTSQPEASTSWQTEGTEPKSPEVPDLVEAGPVSTLIPSGFTASSEKPAEINPHGAESEGSRTTLSPEANTIPGPEKPAIDEEDLKHPPHIHAIDVQCGKEMMTINIEFNREFNGIIYSKGFYNVPECRYVQENSGKTKYTFTVNIEMCGTEFVNAFDTENQSYLENVLVLQNEAGIQEVWDTVRAVRCLWEGSIKDKLSVAFSIGMLSQEIVTFSGDTAMAKLDVVLGRGPFGEPANGLVKIGEEMTLVVSVSGDPGFDLQVKDCKAVDSEGKNSLALTDDEGCILKPKLFGAFQKTKDTGNTGASIIAYAYFNAFKFPDKVDLMIECNIELCKTDCDICSKDNQQLEPSKRRRRDVSYNNTLGDGLTMGKHLRVILPEDLDEKTALEISTINNVCMTVQSFVFSTATLVSLLVLTSVTSSCLWFKRNGRYLKY